MRSVALLSGGLDSIVSFTRATQLTEVALALTFDYGQRAAAREIAAAAAVAGRAGVVHRVVELPWLAEITRTALVSREAELPAPASVAEAGAESAAAVWVPNRNGVFINIAAAFGEPLGARLIVAGFNREEAETFPDNSPEFMAAATQALALSSRSRPEVISYTAHLDKVGIVRWGREIGAPLELVWSCYRGEERHCWRCESCLRLRRGLIDSGNFDWFLAQRGQ
jgi:7-cyano-7-deazaguanine synthase